MIPSGDGKAGEEWLSPGRFTLLLVLFLGAAYPEVIAGRATFFYRDFALFGYPLANYVRESLWHGELPLWNPYNDCGLPFLAQWNTIALYPPSLVYVLLPLSWSLGIFCLGHLVLAGLGMYYLAYYWTRNRYAAAYAGVSFCFSSFILNFLMWPNNVAAMGWCPWVLLANQRACREGGIWLPLGAAAGAMQMLCGAPEVILLTWVLCGLFALSDWAKTAEARVPLRFILISVFTAGLSAFQLLPFLDLLRHSQRDQSFGGSLWSMPLWGWANLLVPLYRSLPTTLGTYAQPGQFWISSYYLGIGVVLFSLVALVRQRDRLTLPIGFAVLICLVLALGSKGIAYDALHRIFPGLGFFRYPIKFVILPAIVMPLLAAIGLNRCLTSPVAAWTGERTCLLSLGSMLLAIIVALIWCAFEFPFEGTSAEVAAWSGLGCGILLAISIGCILVARGTNTGSFQRVALLALLLGIWVDAMTAGPRPNPTVPRAVYEQNLARRELNLKPSPEIGQGRVMLNAEAERGLMLAPLTNATEQVLYSRLALYADINLLDDIPKVVGLYSLIARESGQVLSSLWKSSEPPPGLIDFIGVSRLSSPGKATQWDHRATALPWVSAGQAPVLLGPEDTLERLASAEFNPRTTVFLSPEDKPFVSVTNGCNARVISSNWSSHRIDMEVEAPEAALVVIAQTFYHNWRASIDDRPVPLLRANHAFQAVETPRGRHRLRLVYQDHAFLIGLAVSLLSAVACLCLYLRARKKVHESPLEPQAT